MPSVSIGVLEINRGVYYTLEASEYPKIWYFWKNDPYESFLLLKDPIFNRSKYNLNWFWQPNLGVSLLSKKMFTLL